MQEHRDAADRVALVAGDEIGADILLADVELGLAREPPVPLARAHVGEEDEVEPVGLDRPFLERADDVVVAAGDGQLQLCHRSSFHSVSGCTDLTRASVLARRALTLIGLPGQARQ